MSSHLISKSFGPGCQDVREKKEKTSPNRRKERENEKERLNKLSSRHAFPPANSTVLLDVLCSTVFLPITYPSSS